MNEELSLKESTIQVLEQSQEEFKKLKESFKTAADFFDTGKDIDGLEFIKTSIIPSVSSFYEFCFTLINAFDEVIKGEDLEKLKESFENLDNAMKAITQETKKGNYTEVGDLLRFDFNDTITAFSVLFPKLVERFKNTSSESLDKKA